MTCDAPIHPLVVPRWSLGSTEHLEKVDCSVHPSPLLPLSGWPCGLAETAKRAEQKPIPECPHNSGLMCLFPFCSKLVEYDRLKMMRARCGAGLEEAAHKNRPPPLSGRLEQLRWLISPGSSWGQISTWKTRGWGALKLTPLSTLQMTNPSTPNHCVTRPKF